jgi:hypothetical protein
MTPSRKLLPVFDRFEPTTKDSTAVKTFKECPRKYFYRMVLGRQKPEGEWASVFGWGSGLHKALEHIYQSGDLATATIEALKFWKPPTKDKFDFQTKERFLENIAALVNMWQEEKKSGNIEVLGIEQPFNIIFPDGEVIGGRFDQIIKWNGRVWIRDWKTTSKMIQYWKKGLDPNDQAIRYIYAASCLVHGQDENGYPNKVIDGVLFVAIQNMKSVKAKLERVPISKNITQIKKWVDDQKHVHVMMNYCRENDVWPMHETNCGFCDYQMVCTQPSESAMEFTLKTQYVLSPWKHEEVDQKTLNEN